MEPTTMELLKSTVEQKFTELQEYTRAFNAKAKKDREELVGQAAKQFAEDPSKVDFETLSRDVLYINGFHQTDIRHMQNRFMETYKLYRQLGGDAEFQKELEDVVMRLEVSLPSQIFVCREGSFEEIVDGNLERLLQEYKDKAYFKLFEAQIKQIVELNSKNG